MTTQLLATELANLIQESKRKHNDLRQAAEKSLEELKNLRNNTEQGAPDELSQKPNFVNPFIIACGTKNAKFTAIAIVCLQRLIVARALPRSRLNQVLEALMQASSAGLDVQLKILQALPSLVQNYSAELMGDLLVTALNVCFILQSSKNAIVNNTSAATLQQLVVSVFDKVVAEDKNGDGPIVGDAPTGQGKVELRAAALDAFRIFNDLCLLTENQRPEFIRFTGLPQTFGLELIESVITNHAPVFSSHPEQAYILRVRVMPLLTSALKGKPSFATSVRIVRILYTLLRRHLTILPTECGEALEILTYLLDHDAAPWKRALCMEVFRGIFADHSLLRRIFALYDAEEGERDILKTLTATFVRLSTEKPAVIGLGHQSTIPISSTQAAGSAPDQAVLEAAGVTGIISTSVSETSNTGISTQWSSIRVPCIDQLDKTEPPSIPESYSYSLILNCISSLSDGLAKFILPLTVPTEARSRRKTSKETGRNSPAPSIPETDGGSPRNRPERSSSASFKKNPVPLNPLELEDHPMSSEVKICAAIVDDCWPAILATCSTFLYAALDTEYYHNLVRAFQRFAHVAGLLQLSTPRDAFLTTLGKAAVPPNTFTACLNARQTRSISPNPASDGPTSLLENARGLLGTDNLGASSADKRQPSFEAQNASLNTRNLLCLRALLNLGIALGPTLSSAWRIILETLQQADFVLFSSGKAIGRTSSFPRNQNVGDNEAASLTANFGHEVRAVETAAARLIESTIDFPNEAFLEVLQAVRKLLQQRVADKSESNDNEPTTPATGPGLTPTGQHRRVMSFSNQARASSTQEDQFALAKLGDLASINMERLLTFEPDISGWSLLTQELIGILDLTSRGQSVRVRASEILTRLTLEASKAAVSIPEESRGPIQLRALEALVAAVAPLLQTGRETSVANSATETDIHRILLDGLKSIVEESGESLVEGWGLAFEIIGTIFTVQPPLSEDRRASSILTTRSSKLIRPAFNSLQLICSDFLTSVPNSCFLILVDTLYKFSSQDDDLNIALTTITFFWVVSDFLSGKNESLEITAGLMANREASDLEKMAADRSQKGSDAALWMLLLLRLTTVTSDDRLELRNSAIQTLLRIFDAYGDKLDAEAWSICTRSVIFKLLTSLEDELDTVTAEGEEADLKEWSGTAVVVLNGISNLLANYLDVLMHDSSFNDLWKDITLHLSSLIDFEVLEISTATFQALQHMLSQKTTEGTPILSKEAVDLSWTLWSRGVPVSVAKSKKDDNQTCLVSYVRALREVYSLIKDDLSVDRVRKILDLLHETVEKASVGAYSSDKEQVTQLQGEILGAVEMIRTDVDEVPSALIMQVSRFIALPFRQGSTVDRDPARTYVAMSKASMQMLEKLVLAHASDKDIYESNAFSTALSSLCMPLSLKYQFPIITKSIQPWRMASTTVLRILDPALSQIEKLSLPKHTIHSVWSVIVNISDGILSADCETAAQDSPFHEDEAFDVASFHELRKVVIPRLGEEAVQDEARRTYAESLFKASIIHAPAPADEALVSSNKGAGLAEMYKARSGRTLAVPPTQRTRMAYVALSDLFELVTASESSTPAHVRIACTAAPFLILRCALTLRAYVADQPLRGKMPQPFSQRRELVWTLEKLVQMKSEEESIPALAGVESETRKHLIRLYPLLVKGSGVSSDPEILGLFGGALEVVGGEFGFDP